MFHYQKVVLQQNIEYIRVTFFFFRIININGGKAPLTYHLFQKLLECIDPPESAVPRIDEEFLGDAVTPIDYDHDEIYGVPTLEELGNILLLQ